MKMPDTLPDHIPISLLKTMNMAVEFAKAADQMSSVSATTEQSSPPYSHNGTEQQYSTPESHYDHRTETPTSDTNVDFARINGFSPDAANSERDESPDTSSTSSGGVTDIHGEPAEVKPPAISAEDKELQRQIFRLQGFPSVDDNKNALNLLSTLNNSLLKEKLSAAASFVTERMAGLPTTPVVPLGATLPAPVEATPTKRKRQRRNPVWPYFNVADGTAFCKQCQYSTKSVFSTNLKVHLRSHHRDDYEKVIQAEDALNLNQLLLSGNSRLFQTDLTRKRMPPMTSSILMTLNKLTSAQNSDDNPLNSVLRQTLAAGAGANFNQHLQQVQQQLLQAQQKQMAQQQQQSAPQPAQFPLNAANLAALNNMARNQMATNSMLPSITPEQIMSQLNFPNQMKNEVMHAPHGTDPNGVPQPKRRRLRRHPVWMFFKDLEDRMVGCINCSFRTGSAFSTNLKMHLKAHHKEDYERVLKLEDDMRVEEGICGPPNKMKSELIDFIRGGGNASTSPLQTPNQATAPRASPLVQQIISQSMNQRGINGLKKDVVDDDPFNGMSTSDKLAALVGLVPPAGAVEGEITDHTKSNDQQSGLLNADALDELRKAAERLMAANMGLQPPPQEETMVSLNGSIMHADNSKSNSSASTDVIEDKKSERDRALARLWLDNGANDDMIQSEIFKDLLEQLCNLETTQDDVFPQEASSSNEPTIETTEDTDPTGLDNMSVGQIDISTLTYDGIFTALEVFEKSLGVTEEVACNVFASLLRVSVKNSYEKFVAESVATALTRIATACSEANGNEKSRRVVSEKMKLKKLFETSVERDLRLTRMREQYRSPACSSPMETATTPEEDLPTSSSASFPDFSAVFGLSSSQKGRQSSSPSPFDPEAAAKEAKLAKLREYQRRRLERETPEQREKRLAKMRENQKLRREKRSAQKRAAAVHEASMEFVRTLAPDYDIPESSHLASLVEEEGSFTTVKMD